MNENGVQLIAEDEQFRPIPIDNFGEVYQVSNYGRILSRGILRRVNVAGNGYAQIQLNYNGNRTTQFIHRLVAMVFCNNPNPSKYNIILHKDGCKTNNKYTNLEFGDTRLNNDDVLRLKKYKATRDKNRNNKKPVLSFHYCNGEISDTKSFSSISEASRELKVNARGIRNCCNGYQIRCGGWIFKYL